MGFAADFVPPPGFQTDEFLLRPLLVSDAAADYEAVMASKEFLRIWEGTEWPEDDFTVDQNRADMDKMVGRHNDRHSFGYTMMNLDETQCLGCIYIFPTDVSWLAKLDVEQLGDAAWSSYDLGLAFWVRTDRLDDQLDRRLLDALVPWLATEWSSTGQVITTSEALAQQVSLYESAGLELRFRLTEPGDGAATLAFI